MSSEKTEETPNLTEISDKETSDNHGSTESRLQDTNPTDEGETHLQSKQATNIPTSKSKINVLLKPAGDAPIMKKKLWAVDRNKAVGWVSEFIKNKYLKLSTQDSLFLYVNQSFSPSPDTELGVLFDCFGSDGKLVLHYCKTQAWG